MAALVGYQVGKQLIDALKLPKQTLWFELRVDARELVSVKCCYIPDDLTGDKLVAAIAEYELHRTARPVQKVALSEACPCSDKVRDDFNAWLLERFGEKT